MTTKVESVGVAEAALPTLPSFVPAVLAGTFLRLGAMFATTEGAGSTGVLPWGVGRLLSELGFSVGLIRLIVGGAESLTGSGLIVTAWAGGRVSAKAMLRNGGVVHLGNLVGSLGELPRSVVLPLRVHDDRSHPRHRAADRGLRRDGLRARRRQHRLRTPGLDADRWGRRGPIVGRFLIGNILGGAVLKGAGFQAVSVREAGPRQLAPRRAAWWTVGSQRRDS